MKNIRVSLALGVANIAAISLTLNILPVFAIGNEMRSPTSHNLYDSQAPLFNSRSDGKIAQSCGGRYYRTVSNRQIEQMLDCLNIRYSRQWNGVYTIYLNRYDEYYDLALENCSNRSCRIKLVAARFVERPSSRRIRQWNSNNYRDTYNTRAYLHRQGYIVIESYLSLRGGIESEEVNDFIENFETCLEDFADYIEFSRY